MASQQRHFPFDQDGNRSAMTAFLNARQIWWEVPPARSLASFWLRCTYQAASIQFRSPVPLLAGLLGPELSGLWAARAHFRPAVRILNFSREGGKVVGQGLQQIAPVPERPPDCRLDLLHGVAIVGR
jgi:hypothetical protein